MSVRAKLPIFQHAAAAGIKMSPFNVDVPKGMHNIFASFPTMINANYFGYEYFPQEDGWHPRINGIGGGDELMTRETVDTELWKTLSGRSIGWSKEIAYEQDAADYAMWHAPRDIQAEMREAAHAILQKEIVVPEVIIPEGKSLDENHSEITLAEEHTAMKQRRALKRERDLMYKSRRA